MSSSGVTSRFGSAQCRSNCSILISAKPLEWFRSILMVIAEASGICGYHRSTVSSRRSLPSPTNCSAIVTANDFVMLPIGACKSAVIGALVFKSEIPRDAIQLPVPGIHRPVITPGKPDLVNPSSSACSSAICELSAIGDNSASVSLRATR